MSRTREDKEQIPAIPDDIPVKSHGEDCLFELDPFLSYTRKGNDLSFSIRTKDSHSATDGYPSQDLDRTELVKDDTLHIVHIIYDKSRRIVYYKKDGIYIDHTIPAYILGHAQTLAQTYGEQHEQNKCLITHLNIYLLEQNPNFQAHAAIDRLFNPYSQAYHSQAYRSGNHQAEYIFAQQIKTDLAALKDAISCKGNLEVNKRFTALNNALIDQSILIGNNGMHVIDWSIIIQRYKELRTFIEKNYPYSNFSRVCSILSASLMGGIMAKFLGVSGLTLAAGVTIPGCALGFLIAGISALLTLACYHMHTYTHFLRSKPSEAGLYKSTLDASLKLCNTLKLAFQQKQLSPG